LREAHIATDERNVLKGVSGLARTLQKSGARRVTRGQIEPPTRRGPLPAEQGMEHVAVIRRMQNRLAPGRQIRIEWRQDRPVLVQPNGGTVQLNDSAAAILELCDGTRTSDEVIAEFLAQPGRQELASDVRDFIDAALSRGWIVQT
jgi:pyrroloquinoline quinone biosynthesis protein D